MRSQVRFSRPTKSKKNDFVGLKVQEFMAYLQTFRSLLEDELSMIVHGFKEERKTFVQFIFFATINTLQRSRSQVNWAQFSCHETWEKNSKCRGLGIQTLYSYLRGCRFFFFYKGLKKLSKGLEALKRSYATSFSAPSH